MRSSLCLLFGGRADILARLTWIEFAALKKSLLTVAALEPAAGLMRDHRRVVDKSTFERLGSDRKQRELVRGVCVHVVQNASNGETLNLRSHFVQRDHSTQVEPIPSE
jgi:hypothetical protein